MNYNKCYFIDNSLAYRIIDIKCHLPIVKIQKVIGGIVSCKSFQLNKKNIFLKFDRRFLNNGLNLIILNNNNNNSLTVFLLMVLPRKIKTLIIIDYS